MPIDPGAWVEAHLEGVHKRGGSYEADCPFCGKAGHLYVHAGEGYWTCFAASCGASGRDLTRLIAEVEGLTIAEARRRLFREVVEFRRRQLVEPEQVNERLRRLRVREKQLTVDTPPPPGLVPVFDGRRWRMPQYLLDRGVTRRLAMAYGIGHCSDRLCPEAPAGCHFPEGTPTCTERGRCRYGNRVILPYRCPNGRSFQARALLPDLEPKYLNPPSPKGVLLYGWESAVTGGELVVSEGPFDVLRLIGHGMAAVAVMGLSLGRGQLNLLAQLRLASVTVMLDAGVVTEALGMAGDLIGVAGEVYVAELPAGLDPGDTTRDQAWQAYRGAKRYRGGRSTRAGAIGGRLRALDR
jgi:DNA primase